MTSQQALNDQLYSVTRRPAVPLTGRKETDAATQDARDLLTRGADANYREGLEKWSVLDSAISSGNADIVQLLLDNGAKVTARTVGLVGVTVARVQEDYDGVASRPDPLDLSSIFKQATDEREKIASLVFEKAAKEDFIGRNWKGETILDLVAVSPEATALLRKAMKKHGLTDADLSSPKTGRISKFLGKIFRSPGF